MQPLDLHTLLLWLLIIGAVCLTSLAGAAANRLLEHKVRIRATAGRRTTEHLTDKQ
ncbi:MAG: hypothetical protein K2H99_00010 [Paramuribaculum sp.]|nr:hypothetical protein [Paramuribaculum sp.]MDE5921765.1 hypothetical protein [Paramuribaculum sp.]